MKLSEQRRRTKNLALASLFCALGVVFLYLGAVIEVLDMSAAFLASVPILLAVIEMGGAWPWLIYAVTSILSLVLLPVKLPCVYYILLLGFYPIIKRVLEKHLRGVLGFLVKMGVFGVCLVGMWGVIRLFLPAVVFEGGVWFWAIALFVLMVLYDVCLTLMVTRYVLDWHKRFFKRK